MMYKSKALICPITVAMAAPATPSAGKPSNPKIRIGSSIILTTQPAMRRYIVIFISPIPWKIFSNAIWKREPKERQSTISVYMDASFNIFGLSVKSFKNGSEIVRPAMIKKMQWINVRAIPRVAARSAFSRFPAPKWMEIAELIPTPIPTAADKIAFWSG